MVGVQRCYLTAVVARLVRILVIHVVGDANLGEDARVHSRVLSALVADRLELVREAVSNRRLSNLDGKCRRQVLSSQHAENVHVPHPVPALH